MCIWMPLVRNLIVQIICWLSTYRKNCQMSPGAFLCSIHGAGYQVQGQAYSSFQLINMWQPCCVQVEQAMAAKVIKTKTYYSTHNYHQSACKCQCTMAVTTVQSVYLHGPSWELYCQWKSKRASKQYGNWLEDKSAPPIASPPLWVQGQCNNYDGV